MGMQLQLWAWVFIAVPNNITWFNIVTNEYVQTVLNKVTQAKMAVCAAWYENPKTQWEKIGNVFLKQMQLHKP